MLAHRGFAIAYRSKPMTQFIPWHLKYRPQVLKGLYGQEIVQKSLSNLISSGKMPHALLFSGPRGTGKTSTASWATASMSSKSMRHPTTESIRYES